MKKDIIVAPSVLSADFTKLGQEVKKIEEAGADMIHIDVMDGHFVPNITIGPLVVRAVKKVSSLPLDTHLMIEDPHGFIKEFADAGSDIITVHAEAYGQDPESGILNPEKGVSKSVDKINKNKMKDAIKQIKSLGKKAGISLNPGSPFPCIRGVLDETDMLLLMSVHPGFGGQRFIEGVLPKIKEARASYAGDIEVDGGINGGNIGKVIDAGANIIVAGSYFFNSGDPKEAVKKLRNRQNQKG